MKIIVSNNKDSYFCLTLFSKRRFQIVKVRNGITNGTCRAALHFSISIQLPALSLTTTGSLFYGDNRRETSATRAGTHREILRIYIGIQFNSSHSLNSTRKWMSLAPTRYKVPALSADNRISPNLRVEFKYGWIDTIAISNAMAEIHIIERRRSKSRSCFTYSETFERKKGYHNEFTHCKLTITRSLTIAIVPQYFPPSN